MKTLQCGDSEVNFYVVFHLKMTVIWKQKLPLVESHLAVWHQGIYTGGGGKTPLRITVKSNYGGE